MFSIPIFSRNSLISNGILKTCIGFKLEVSSRQFLRTCYVAKAHESGNKTKRNLSKGQPRVTQKQLQQLVMADAHFMQRQKNGVLQVFPNVPSTIKNMYYNLSTNLNPSYRYEQSVSAVGRVNNQLVFQCSSKIKWPRPLTFQGYGFSKKNAELVAMLKILEMLHEEKYIGENGYPITISSEEQEKIRKEWNSPVSIRLPVSLMEEGFSIIQNFHEEIKPQMDMKTDPTAVITAGLTEESDDEFGVERATEDIDEDDSFCWEEDKENNYILDMFTGRQYIEPSREENIHRSQKMLQLLQAREMSKGTQPQASLPMSHYRDALQTALDKSRVVVIAGDTGCGKSTQVPQMIIDDWIRKGNGANCNILVTQPRRISAISLAKRVAKERREKIGESVGFHVRLHYQRLREQGGVMFCTTGMLLQGLHSNPTLKGVSHVIVDEVHERSVQTDLLLIILRRLLRSSDDLRIIFMSASLSTVQLQKYFEAEEATVIEVPGTLYPLTRHYLPCALNELQINSRHYQLDSLMEPGSQPFINYDLVVDVIKSIQNSRPPGAILCFLPGWQDIRTVQTRLTEEKELESMLWVLPLHSRLSSSDQEQIFEEAAEGRRKVVLATNLAETSLTVQDVVYVVDTGCHKEQRYDPKKNLSILANHWISRANSQQRAGRAGRVQPGEVFHLYSSKVHMDMGRFPVPEIMRIPLEHVILQCKAHCGDENALSFLSEGLSVPSRRLISKAVSTLEDLGMLEILDQGATEKLTALGRRVVHFSTPPHLSKALVYASVFKCLNPVLKITASLTSGRDIFLNNIENRAETRAVKTQMNNTSDLLAIARLCSAWEELDHYKDKIDFCNDNNLNHRSIMYNLGISRVYADHLYDGFLLNKEDISSPFSSWNAFSSNNQLVLGVLLAGVGRILHLQRGVLSKGIFRSDSFVIKTLDNKQVHTGSDCVLHQLPKDQDMSCHLLCVNLTRDEVSRRTIARDLSLLQPLTVAIFTEQKLVAEESEDGWQISVDGKEQLSFHLDERTAKFIFQLRNIMKETVSYIVETRGLDSEVPPPHEIETFCDTLLSFINKLFETSQNFKKFQKLEEKEDLGF